MAMRMGSLGGGVPGGTRPRAPGGTRPVYEDFKPMPEWQHEEGADVLLLHLPGFMKEQLRILADSRGILRIRGERLVAGNKRSRFQEEIQVPEDCTINEIRAKFERGILRVTMPKKPVPQTQPVEEPNAGEQSTQLPPAKPSVEELTPNANLPMASAPLPTVKPPSDLAKSSNNSQEDLPQKTRKDQEQATDTHTLNASSDEKWGKGKVDGEAEETKEKDMMLPQRIMKDQEAIGKPALNAQSQSETKQVEKVKETQEKIEDMTVPQRGKKDQEVLDKPALKDQSQSETKEVEKGKQTEEKLKDMMVPQRERKDQEVLDRPTLNSSGDKPSESKQVAAKGKETKELKDSMVPQWARKDGDEGKDINKPTLNASVDKQGGAEIGRKMQQGNLEEDQGKTQVEGSKEKVGSKENLNNLRSLDEERQLLVNVGVAVLVIMALGAYISHSFGFSSD
ncbi:hypothetical protein Ancab_023831 [Ancistrocladus abbreviatus]